MLALLLTLVAPPAPQPSPEPQGLGLIATLKADATCVAGKAPNVRVTIRNNLGRDVLLVGSLDASDCKRRYPHCYFEVIRPDGTSVPLSVPRCGNKNPLRDRDFVAVPRNGTFDPYAQIDQYGFFGAHQLSSGNFTTPGTYRLRFFYSTEAKEMKGWCGDGDLSANLIAKLKRVPRVTLRSNEVTIRVVAPKR